MHMQIRAQFTAQRRYINFSPRVYLFATIADFACEQTPICNNKQESCLNVRLKEKRGGGGEGWIGDN